LGFLKTFLLYGNIYVVVPILSLFFSTQLIFKGNLEWNSEAAFLLGGSLALYPAHRILSVYLTQKPYRLERLKALQNVKLFLLIPVVSGSLLAFSAFLKLDELNLFLLVLLMFLSVAYSVPFIQLNGKWWRLRDVPYMKVFVVSLVVVLLTTYLAVSAEPELNVHKLILWLLAQFFFILGLTIPFDVRDFDIDSKNGTKTLPVLFGKELALKIATASLVFYELFCFSIYVLFPELPFTYFIVLLLSGFWSTLWLINVKSSSKELFFTWAFEGAIVLQFLLLFAAYTLNQ